MRIDSGNFKNSKYMILSPTVRFLEYNKYVEDEGMENLVFDIPVSLLQEEPNLGTLEAGTYYIQKNPHGFNISLLITAHSFSISTERKQNEDTVIKDLYYDVHMHTLTFRTKINDKFGSTHFSKLHKNIPIKHQPVHQIFTEEELNEYMEQILNEVREFDGLDEIISNEFSSVGIVDYESIENSIIKNLRGIRR